jgi:hypothetical protein
LRAYARAYTTTQKMSVQWAVHPAIDVVYLPVYHTDPAAWALAYTRTVNMFHLLHAPLPILHTVAVGFWLSRGREPHIGDMRKSSIIDRIHTAGYTLFSTRSTAWSQPGFLSGGSSRLARDIMS